MATISLAIEPVQPLVKPNIHISDSKAIYRKNKHRSLSALNF